MMGRQHNRQSEQLDLLIPNKSNFEHQQLNQAVRKEVTELLVLLLGECINRKVVTKEGSNDQDQR